MVGQYSFRIFRISKYIKKKKDDENSTTKECKNTISGKQSWNKLFVLLFLHASGRIAKAAGALDHSASCKTKYDSYAPVACCSYSHSRIQSLRSYQKVFQRIGDTQHQLTKINRLPAEKLREKKKVPCFGKKELQPSEIYCKTFCTA